MSTIVEIFACCCINVSSPFAFPFCAGLSYRTPYSGHTHKHRMRPRFDYLAHIKRNCRIWKWSHPLTQSIKPHRYTPYAEQNSRDGGVFVDLFDLAFHQCHSRERSCLRHRVVHLHFRSLSAEHEIIVLRLFRKNIAENMINSGQKDADCRNFQLCFYSPYHAYHLLQYLNVTEKRDSEKGNERASMFVIKEAVSHKTLQKKASSIGCFSYCFVLLAHSMAVTFICANRSVFSRFHFIQSAEVPNSRASDDKKHIQFINSWIVLGQISWLFDNLSKWKIA